MLLLKPTLDLADPANYLPVSSLSFLGKVIQRAATKQLQQLVDTLVLDPFQSSFHPSHGMKMVLVSLRSRCSEIADN